MNENDNNRSTVRLTEVNQTASTDVEETSENRFKKLKKPIIFSLMAMVFVGCMYLIFVPASDRSKTEQIGLHDGGPQPTVAVMLE
jgi:hypothetical protein